jgi:hypothetical protein
MVENNGKWGRGVESRKYNFLDFFALPGKSSPQRLHLKRNLNEKQKLVKQKSGRRNL